MSHDGEQKDSSFMIQIGYAAESYFKDIPKRIDIITLLTLILTLGLELRCPVTWLNA